MFKAQILETFKMKKTDVAASLCCITNHPKTTCWLKTTIFLLAHDFVGQQFGLGSSGWVFCWS